MCGLLALVDTPWQSGAEAALAPLEYRGPDAKTRWKDGETFLGHTRLSIIDLAGGAQPMATEDGRYVLAYNGESYNFQALRKELERRGQRFTTRSDTEVILRGYVEWGSDVVKRLDGIFAFAIWDARERTLFAARDRLGVKPLLYSTHRGLAMASTLAPFLALDGFPRELDYEALRDYLAFQTPLAPHSFLKAVRQLPPAHWLEWKDDAVRIERYWSIPQPTNEKESGSVTAQLDSLLAQTVARQLVADVPLGAFLSGGIELFGGYERFLDTEERNPDSLSKRVLRGLLAAGLAPGALLRRSLAGQDLLLYRRTELGPWSVSRKSLSLYLENEFLPASRPEATLSLWRHLANSFGGRMDSAALMRADLWTYLSEN